MKEGWLYMNRENYSKKSKDELKQILTQIQYEVTQNNATERPFQNEYFNEFRKGMKNLNPAADGPVLLNPLIKIRL